MTESGSSVAEEAAAGGEYQYDSLSLAMRIFAWAIVAATFAFLLNVYLNHWRGWPGAGAITSGGGGLAWLQAITYLAAIGGPIFYVMRSKERTLRADGFSLDQITRYIIRAAFWMM